MGKFDKRDTCEYCGSKMDAKYRNKRFCSSKCRVYFNRENGKPVPKIEKETNYTQEKQLSKADLLKLMRKNGQF